MKPIYFNKIKLTLYPQVKNSMTQLTLVFILEKNMMIFYEMTVFL